MLVSAGDRGYEELRSSCLGLEEARELICRTCNQKPSLSDRVGTVGTDSLKASALLVGNGSLARSSTVALQQVSTESTLRELIKRLPELSSSGVATLKNFFRDKFLSRHAFLVTRSFEPSAGVQWLKASHDTDSPLLSFFKKVGLLNELNQVDSTLPVGVMNELLEEALTVLQMLLEGESRWVGGINFSYDDLSELEEQLKELSYRKFSNFLAYALEKNPNDGLLHDLRLIVDRAISVNEKLELCTEALKGEERPVFVAILDHIFLGKDPVRDSSRELFVESSSLLAKLGVKWEEYGLVIGQWGVRNAFCREANKIIYSQYIEKLQELELGFLLEFDADLKADNPEITLEDLLVKVRNYVHRISPPLEEQSDLEEILDGGRCEAPLQKLIEELHEEVFSAICIREESVETTYYEKFAQLYFFFSAMYKSIVEEIAKLGLHPVYVEFAKCAYLDGNVNALYWIVHTLAYQKYLNCLRELGDSSLKDELLAKDRELTEEAVDMGEKIQRTCAFVSGPRFSSVADILLPKLRSSFRLNKAPPSLLKGFDLSHDVVHFSTSKEGLHKFARDVLDKERAEIPQHHSQWKAIEAFLKKEEGSPFWFFLRSRGFLTKSIQEDSCFHRICKFSEYLAVFQALVVRSAKLLHKHFSFASASLSEVNDYAREIALEHVLNQLKKVSPFLQEDLIQQFKDIGDNQALSPREKSSQTLELLETIEHSEVNQLKALLSGAVFIGVEDIESFFSWKWVKKADGIIPALFQQIGVKSLPDLSADDNYFEKLDFVEDMKTYFHSLIIEDEDLEQELESIENWNLAGLEPIFQTIFKRHLLAQVGSKANGIALVVNRFCSQINERVIWLSTKALEYDLLDLRRGLQAATTPFEKTIALRKGFYLLQERLKLEIASKNANPSFVGFVEESCLDQNIRALDGLIMEMNK